MLQRNCSLVVYLAALKTQSLSHITDTVRFQSGEPVWQARPFIRGSQLREPVFRTDQGRGIIEILSHDLRKGGKGTEIPQHGKKRWKHEQERDRIIPERGHISGKGFCGSGTRGVHRFRHACQRQLLQGKAGDV